MRIAVVTWTDRAAGGVETYLEHVIPELCALGHEISLWHETSDPVTRSAFQRPESVFASRLDAHDGIATLARWAPDVVLANGLGNPALERTVIGIAPTVFVAHNYHGTCISGTKCWSWPVRRPCTRKFGWQCLAHYYPHRCGGLHPLTMVRLYGAARSRLETVRRCAHVVTLSEHMRDEYVVHGIAPDTVSAIPYGPPPPPPGAGARRGDAIATIACIARLEPLKGVDLLLDALPLIGRRVARPLRVVIVGEGSRRPVLEESAARVTASNPGVSVEFRGWLPPPDRNRVLATAHVLALPGPWPEPFGIVGLEAAHLAVPSVAFDVGGVADWLEDGLTGRLVTGRPPSAQALGTILGDLLADPAACARLGDQARVAARRRSPRAHAAGLVERLAAARVTPGMA